MDRLYTGYIVGAAVASFAVVVCLIADMPVWQGLVTIVIGTPIGIWIAQRCDRRRENEV